MSIKDIDVEKVVVIKGSFSENSSAINQYIDDIGISQEEDAVAIYNAVGMASIFSSLGKFSTNMPGDFGDFSFVVPLNEDGEKIIEQMSNLKLINIFHEAEITITRRDQDAEQDDYEKELDIITDNIVRFSLESSDSEDRGISKNKIQRFFAQNLVSPLFENNLNSKRILLNKLSTQIQPFDSDINFDEIALTEDEMNAIEENIPTDSEISENISTGDDSDASQYLRQMLQNDNIDNSGGLGEMFNDRNIDSIIENSFYEESLYSSLWSKALITNIFVRKNGVHSFIKNDLGDVNTSIELPSGIIGDPSTLTRDSVAIELAENSILEPLCRRSTQTIFFTAINTNLGSGSFSLDMNINDLMSSGFFILSRFNMSMDDYSIEPDVNGEYMLITGAELYGYVSMGGSCELLSCGRVKKNEDYQDNDQNESITLHDVTLARSHHNGIDFYSKKDIAKNIQKFADLTINSGSDDSEDGGKAAISIDNTSIYSLLNDSENLPLVKSALPLDVINEKYMEIISKCNRE